MTRATLTIDTRAYRAAFRDFYRESKKTKTEVVRFEARAFTRAIILNTPPNDGSPGKKKMETILAKNLSRLFVGVSIKGAREESHPDVEAVYRRRNSRRHNGQITRGQKALYFVDKEKLNALHKKLIRNIGMLISGWSAAAIELGVSVSAWITRHGRSRGSIKIREAADGGSITITNAVPYATEVKGFESRVQRTFDDRARAMQRQMLRHALAKAARKAGLKIR